MIPKVMYFIIITFNNVTLTHQTDYIFITQLITTNRKTKQKPIYFALLCLFVAIYNETSEIKTSIKKNIFQIFYFI